MNLPHPRAELAGCCWLPRLTAKTRGYLKGEMPLNYRVAFGSRLGIDGYFFRHFGLTRTQVIAAIRTAPSDAAVAQWFLGRPGVTAPSIATWNELAPRLGAKGNPGYLTRVAVKWILYPALFLRPVVSLFEMIAQDENLSPP